MLALIVFSIIYSETISILIFKTFYVHYKTFYPHLVKNVKASLSVVQIPFQ